MEKSSILIAILVVVAIGLFVATAIIAVKQGNAFTAAGLAVGGVLAVVLAIVVGYRAYYGYITW